MAYLPSRFPEAVMTVRPQENIFEKIFAASETPLVVEVALAAEKSVPPVERMMEINGLLAGQWPEAGIMAPQLERR
jgi:hypothetical protein